MRCSMNRQRCTVVWFRQSLDFSLECPQTLHHVFDDEPCLCQLVLSRVVFRETTDGSFEPLHGASEVADCDPNVGFVRDAR